MPEAGHESVEHTADLSIRAWAPDLAGLIEQAARGMIDLMLSATVQPERWVEVKGEGDTPEDLLVDCVREILLLIELEGLVPVSVEVTGGDRGSAVCHVGVVPLERSRDVLVEDIKAVTYHGLDVRREADSLVVQLVFDV